MPTINDLRQALGAAAQGRSDQELLRVYADVTGSSPVQAAQQFSYGASDNGMWGNRVSASVDNYQANMYGLAEAMGAGDWARRGRINNEFDSQLAAQRARSQGAVDSFRDVSGIGSGLNYVGGLAVQSLPYMGEALLGGGVGGLAARGATAAVRAGARTAGGVTASYPSAVGDILSNQREQADGQTNLGTAAALGIPYALLNAFGLEGAIARTQGFRNGVRALDARDGFLGGAQRALATGTGVGLKEGASELGQEVLNQVGRNAVDPNAGYFGPEAADRYAESLVGGFALGGAGGAIGGGWRRSEGYGQPTVDPNAPQDLLAPPPPPAPPSYPVALRPEFGVTAPPPQFTPVEPVPDGPTTEFAGMPPALPYTPRDPNTLIATADGTVADPRTGSLSGVQGGLFPGFESYTPPDATGEQMADEPPAGPTDGGAPLFDSQPTSTVQTDFGLPQLRQRVLGAVKGKLDGWSMKVTTALAQDMPKDPEGTLQYLADMRDKIERSKLSQPTIDQRLKTIAALEGAVMDYQTRMDDARRQEVTIQADNRRAVAEKWGRLGPTYTTTAPIGPQRTEEMMRRNSARTLEEERQAEERFYDEVQADENGVRSTPNEMDPNLVREAKPRGPDADGQQNLFSKRETPVMRGPRSQALRGPAGTATSSDPWATRDREPAGENAPTSEQYAASRPFDEDAYAPTEGQTTAIGPRGGVTADARRTGPRGAAPAATIAPQQAQAEGTSAQGTGATRSEPATPLSNLARRFAELSAEVDAELAAAEAAERAPAPAPAPKAPAPAPKPAAPAPAPRQGAVDRRAAELADAERALAELKRTIDRMPESAGLRRQLQERYWDAQTRVEKAREALVADRRPKATAPAAAPTPAPAPANDPMVNLAAELTRERTPAEKAEGKRQTASVVNEELEMIQKLVDKYNGLVGAVPKGLEAKERKAKDIKRWVADLQALAAEGSSAKVRKAAAAAIEENVAPQHLGGTKLRARGDSGSMSTEEVQQVVEEALPPGAPTVEVVGGPGDVAGLPVPPGVNPTGVFHKGKVYLFADNLASRVEVLRTIFHELFHQGLSKILPKEQYRQAMLRLMSTDPKTREYAKRWRESAEGVERRGSMPENDWYALSAEEALADIAEDIKANASAMTSTVRNLARWLASVADALRLRGVAQMIRNLPYTEAEQFVLQALDASFEPGPGTGGDGPRFRSERESMDLPPPKESGRMESAVNAIRGSLKDWRNTPGVLGWFSLRQLQEQFAKGRENVEKYVSGVLQRSQRAEQLVSELAAVVTPWRNLPQETQVALGRVMLEATMLRGHIDKDWTDASNDHLRAANEAGIDQAEENKREFLRVQAMYDALKPNVQKVYLEGRDAMQRLWEQRAKAKIGLIKTAYAPELREYLSDAELDDIVTAPDKVKRDLLETAKYVALPRNARKALRSLIEDALAHYEEQAEMKGPYFPLVRFGDHVVVAASKGLTEAKAAFQKARDDLQKLYDEEPPLDPAEEKAYEEQLQAARKAVNAARAALDKLKGDQKHYQVMFFEQRWEAENYLKQLQDNPVVAQNGMEVRLEQRVQHYQELDSASPAFVRKLENSLRTALPKADLGAVKAAVRDVYVRSLPDRAAMKAELRRLNVAGARATEMMRGFTTRGVAHAHAIAHMEFDSQITDALNEMRRSDDRDERLVGEEFAKRHMISMQPPQRNKVFERLAQMSHLTFLGLSPSYIMMNMAQPWVVSAPIVASRHGWGATATALGNASVEVAGMLKVLRAEEGKRLKDAGVPWATARSYRFDIQPERLGKTDEERQMLRALFNDGLINITIEHDMGAVAEGLEQNWFDKVNQVASTPAHLVEVVNRVATALAAFRLHQAKGESYATSVTYATQVVADTHLDYSAENAPRLMRPDSFGGLGRLIFQFKKYMQGMLYLNAKLARGMFKGDKDAQRAFAYLWGTTLAVSGAVGLPVAGIVGIGASALSKLWDDDDEPDIAQMFYNGMKDTLGEDIARLLWKGGPAALGVDLSQRLGMGSITNPGQFIDTSKDGRALFGNILIGLGGPSAAMMANWFDAASVASTDPMRAWQLAVPKVISDPLKAIDRENRGIVSRSGNELVSAEDFGAARAIAKTFGLESTDITDMYAQRAAVNNAKQAKDNVRRGLIRQYLEERNSGGDPGAIMDKILDYNARNPNDRITMSVINQSAQRRKDEQKDMVGGVSIKKRDRDVLDQVGSEE